MPTSICNVNHILIGLGGTGGKILKAFKMRMFEEFPDSKERVKNSVSLLYIDSTMEMMPKDGRPRPDFRVMGQDASFTNEEFLNIKGTDISNVLDHIDSYPAVKAIVQDAKAVKSAIGNLGEAAGQMRRAGRLLFATNAVAYVNALKNAFARCSARSGNQGELYIHIFAGLNGGTGSGSIIDAIVQARKSFPTANIAVYAMIPEQHLPKADMDQGRYYPNGYAALCELSALQAGRYKPHDVTSAGEIADLFNVKHKGVANGITLYSNVNDNGMALNSLEELPKVISDYVYARIFLINQENKVNEDIIKGYTYENIDRHFMEYDELSNSNPPAMARTKKVNTFGIKRVMYPELRVLKHITYTVGESILLQFKYNNWREESGFIDEEANKDYRELYINEKQLQKWMLDISHLTLDKKILSTDKDHQSISDYWHDRAIDFANDKSVKSANCPLNELDAILGEDFFARQFRGAGVEAYYRDKAKSIPEMAREVRHNIEKELYESWKGGDVSIVELQKVSKLLLEAVGELRLKIEEKIKKNEEDVQIISDDCKANVEEWSNLNILQRLAQKGNRIFARHQNDLVDLYTERTMMVGLQFAKSLSQKVLNELQNMDTDIGTFSEIINSAIKQTEDLITAQRKVNKGLEDMRGAIIEVSEDETMKEFEVELKLDKIDMPAMATQIRNAVLPKSEFTNFGRLAVDISVDDIRDAFDITLSKIIRAKHNEKASTEKKVLGMNILTQLQQKLLTDEDINAFAVKIVKQSGVYLQLNHDQIQLHVRNNEGELSPTNTASINKKVILVSFPKPQDERQRVFASKLERAFSSSFQQGVARTTIGFFTDSPRENELSIITIGYCFPMRCADWLKEYKLKYEHFLHTGNPATDASNAILLHTEGDGSQLPSLFVVEKTEPSSPMTPPPPPQPVLAITVLVNGQPVGPCDANKLQQMVASGTLNPQSLVWKEGLPSWLQASQLPELKTLFAPAVPIMPPIIQPEPDPVVQVMVAVNRQAIGPKNWAELKQMVQTGELTKDTLVWMQGIPAWTPAGQVPQLAKLFAGSVPSGMPAIPGMPGMPSL